MRIAIIPARGGSKRVKSKNIIDFFGKPMISYALEAAQKSNLFSKIHVSTESAEITKVVEDLGFTVDFLRPKELADDFTGLVPVLEFVVKKYQSQAKVYDDVCCIMPTAPLLKSEDLIKAFDIYEAQNKQLPLFVTAEFPVAIEWAYRKDGKGVITPVSPESLVKRSQDLPKAYYEAGPFNIFHASHLRGNETLTKGIFVSYTMPKNRAVDIDTEEDLLFAKTLFKGQTI